MTRLRMFLRYSLAFMLSLLPVIATANSSAVILQYHHISSKTPKSTSVTPETFTQHLEYLDKNDFNVLPLSKVTHALKTGMPLPKKTVVITFDDAYLNIYENAFPLIKKKGWPFTLFVSTDPVDKNYGKFLNWSQLQEMAKNNASIANHTLAHDHLVEKKPNESESGWLERVRQDIIKTEQRIKDKTGQNIQHFAWPYGETTPELRKLITELGYIGLGQQSGAASTLSDFTRLPRYPMAGSYAEMGSFKLKVNSLPLPVTKQMPDSSIISKKDLKPVLEIVVENGPYQKNQLRCYGTGQGELTVKWLDKEKSRFTTQAKSPLPIGRSRYNCTAPSIDGKQYYWFSHAWLRLTEEGKAVN